MNNRVSKGKRRADKLFKFEMTFSLPKKFAKLVTGDRGGSSSSPFYLVLVYFFFKFFRSAGCRVLVLNDGCICRW
jgi:hypothetical protein